MSSSIRPVSRLQPELPHHPVDSTELTTLNVVPLPREIYTGAPIKKHRLIVFLKRFVATNVVQHPQKSMTAASQLPPEQMLTALKFVADFARWRPLTGLEGAHDTIYVLIFTEPRLKINHLKAEFIARQVWLIVQNCIDCSNKRILVLDFSSTRRVHCQ